MSSERGGPPLPAVPLVVASPATKSAPPQATQDRRPKAKHKLGNSSNKRSEQTRLATVKWLDSGRMRDRRIARRRRRQAPP